MSARALASPAALAAAAALTATGCGDDGGARKNADPFKAVSREPSLTRTARNAAPRWERVTRVTGSQAAIHPVAIAKGAIQWRARWRCTRGAIALTVEPAPRSAAERSGGRCPGSGETTWVQTGRQALRVRGGGRWSVVVDQQVDTAIAEPMLAAMRARGARLLARGSFYPVERQGRGRVRLYRLAGGRGALRLDPFTTSSNTDLFVWLSVARRPPTTRSVVGARRLGRLIPLKSTIGAQNYLLPASVDARRIRSVAIWCAPIRIVYTAAALRRGA